MPKKKILLTCLVVLALSGCGQQELEKLKAENIALKTKVGVLEQENAKLKETDQTYFNRGVDALKDATSKASLQTALDAFTEMLKKFPQSPYSPKAQQSIAEVKKRIGDIERVETARSQFDAALSEHKYDAASAELRKLKTLIPESEHKELAGRLYEERNKPREITINKLISDFGSLNRSFDPNVFKLVGMRVRFEATFSSVDRDRKALRAYSEGWGKGSDIEVFYDKTNLLDYFTNTDPKCCDNRYTVTGKTAIYSNGGTLYVQAEKIDVIQH